MTSPAPSPDPAPYGRWIASRLFSSPVLRPRTPQADAAAYTLPPVRPNSAGDALEACPADAEGAFVADGRGLHIALLGTGLPPDLPRPFSRMEVYPVGRDDASDATRHEAVNLSLLSGWLPAAHYHIFALRAQARPDGVLGVSDRHIDAALEHCRRLPRLDFIIASIVPSDHRFLGNAHLFARGPGAHPAVSFWPTGNWRPGDPPQRRQQIGSVNRHIIIAGQALQWGLLPRRFELYRVPPTARYDREHGLPHFWAPGPRRAPGATGSSYGPVPVALVWIQLAQTLSYLRHHRLLAEDLGDLTDFLRLQLRQGRSGRRRLLAPGLPRFATATRGLVNLPGALQQALAALQKPQTAQQTLAVLYRRRVPRARRRALPLVLGGLAAAAGWSLHLDAWIYYAPALDLIYFDGWTYITALAAPQRVVDLAPWSAALWGLGGLLGGLLLGIRRRVWEV